MSADDLVRCLLPTPDGLSWDVVSAPRSLGLPLAPDEPALPNPVPSTGTLSLHSPSQPRRTTTTTTTTTREVIVVEDSEPEPTTVDDEAEDPKCCVCFETAPWLERHPGCRAYYCAPCLAGTYSGQIGTIGFTEGLVTCAWCRGSWPLTEFGAPATHAQIMGVIRLAKEEAAEERQEEEEPVSRREVARLQAEIDNLREVVLPFSNERWNYWRRRAYYLEDRVEALGGRVVRERPAARRARVRNRADEFVYSRDHTDPDFI